MTLFVRQIVLILFMWLMLVGVCLGKQVFLKDGGIIDCQSAWQKGDKVFVKVNRDIVADFNLNEIDLRRTFPGSGTSTRHVQRKGKPAPALGTVKSATSAPAVVKSAPKPAALPASAAAPVAKEPLPQVAPPTAPATPPDKAEMIQKALEMQKTAMPQAGGTSKAMAGFSTTLLLVILAVCLLIIAGYWMVFQKAGQAGWKSLIPFYNMYILMEISGKPGWWMFLLIIPLVGVVVLLFAMLALARKFGRSELFGVGLLLLPMIFFPLLAFGGSEYEG